MQSAENTETSLPSADSSDYKRNETMILARVKKLDKSGDDIGRLFVAGARNAPRGEEIRRVSVKFNRPLSLIIRSGE